MAVTPSFFVNECADILAPRNAQQISRRPQIEYPQRQAVVATHHDRRRIHDIESLIEHAIIGEAWVVLRVRILDRVFGEDTVYLGRLEQQLRLDLDRAQAGSRIRGEEWIAGPRSEDHRTALLQMPHRAPTDE